MPKSVRYQMLLASRLLSMAAAEFHEHGCNDVDSKLFEGISVHQRALLLEDFNDWYQSTFQVPIPPLDLQEVGDDQWMEYLASVFSGKERVQQI